MNSAMEAAYSTTAGTASIALHDSLSAVLVAISLIFAAWCINKLWVDFVAGSLEHADLVWGCMRIAVLIALIGYLAS